MAEHRRHVERESAIGRDRRLLDAAPALLAALKESQVALQCAILFIEGAFPEPSDLLHEELISYRVREMKARAAIAQAEGS